MSHSSKLFSRAPIDLPSKSGHNKDHENLFTATCGTLIPAYAKPLLPNDTVSMGVDFQVQLPPMITDFYGKVDAVFEAFFVPNRILWGGWEDFITHPTKNPVYPAETNVRAKPSRKPTVSFTNTRYVGPATLSDYLGFKFFSADTNPVSPATGFDALPFLAYHMIYHHWYRDSRIQAPLFYPRAQAVDSDTSPAQAPYVSIVSTANTTGPTYGIVSQLGDGVPFGSLRQRNWSLGYFTAASPYPQAGGESEIEFATADDGTGAISMSALRSANSLQLWMERNNFSYEYGDQMYGQYGIYPDAAKMDKPIYLGRVKQSVYTRSVFQTSDSSESSINSVVGSKKGSSQSLGEGRLFENFTASEHGFLFVIFSLVPHSYYGTGIARHLYETDVEDIPFPLLAGMGDQEVYHSELVGSSNLADLTVFGFLDRYAHYKYDEDELHGLLRAGSTLEHFALSRDFDSAPSLSSEFLEIPINALDEVQAVSTSEQGFSCWVDSFFKLSYISTLPAYSVPTLASLKDAQPTHKGYMSRGGSKL